MPASTLQVLRVLSALTLADAQQLTVLRAVQKGNAASLVAALAADTAQLFGQAGQQVSKCGGRGAWERPLVAAVADDAGVGVGGGGGGAACAVTWPPAC